MVAVLIDFNFQQLTNVDFFFDIFTVLSAYNEIRYNSLSPEMMKLHGGG